MTDQRAGRRAAMQHRTTVVELGEGVTQAVCSCGWRSDSFGANKKIGTMDALQQAKDAADLHEWDAALSSRE
jgi:molybdopterin synthase catalytic subunit